MGYHQSTILPKELIKFAFYNDVNGHYLDLRDWWNTLRYLICKDVQIKDKYVIFFVNRVLNAILPFFGPSSIALFFS